MALLTRKTLKDFFKKGTSPTEVNFADLIESTVNKIDDGFAKEPEHGLMLSPQNNSRKVMSIYENIKDNNAAWSISLSDETAAKGVSFDDVNGQSALFLREGGNVGIGNEFPTNKLDVNGMVGMRGRVGTFKNGQVPGDGKWHTILSALDKSYALEIVAKINGTKGRGKYALLHAIALCTYGRSWPAIRKTSAHFGWFWHRLNLRWTGDVHNYQLQLKSGSHYGLDENGLPHPIQYHISLLWDDGDTPFQENTNMAAYPAPSEDITVDSLNL